MTADRPVESLEEMVARLAREVADLRSTALVRASRRPTGTMEQTLAAVAPADTILLQGQTLNRADYPGLWKWSQDHNAGGFGVGNGSTTFTVPDARDRVLIGAGGALAVGALVGANTFTLAVTNLPSHGHTVANHDGHFHSINDSGGTDAAGSHGGHVGAGTSPNADGATQSTYTLSLGSHTHPVTTNTSTVGLSAHSVGSTGSGTAFDNRQAGLATNVLIYT